LIAVDTNVLVYAHREDMAQYARAIAWIRRLGEQAAPWALPVFCLAEFVRVTTHPRVFDPPSTLKQATTWLWTICESPSLRILNPGPRYPALYREALQAADARGNLAYDAQIAALCREHGVSRLLTLDRDFSRFPGLSIVSLNEEPKA
jgi:hypothetical protein